MSTDGALLSVVVVNWNSGDALARCLTSIHRHPPARPWEIVVVDNASVDDSVALARRCGVEALYVVNSENRGLPAANNQGFMAARGELLLVSNPDVEVQVGAIDALCSVLDRRPTAAIAVPQVLQPGARPQVSVGNLPNLRQAMLGRLAADADGEGYWWHGWAHDLERAVEHGAEACFALRRSALVDVGPQDERFVLDWEGIDLSARLKDAGWEVWFTPEALIEHAGGVSIRQVPYRWIVRSHRGMYRYFSLRTPRPAAPALALAIGARAAAKLALEAVGSKHYERARRRARGPGTLRAG